MAPSSFSYPLEPSGLTSRLKKEVGNYWRGFVDALCALKGGNKSSSSRERCRVLIYGDIRCDRPVSKTDPNKEPFCKQHIKVRHLEHAGYHLYVDEELKKTERYKKRVILHEHVGTSDRLAAIIEHQQRQRYTVKYNYFNSENHQHYERKLRRAYQGCIDIWDHRIEILRVDPVTEGGRLSEEVIAELRLLREGVVVPVGRAVEPVPVEGDSWGGVLMVEID